MDNMHSYEMRCVCVCVLDEFTNATNRMECLTIHWSDHNSERANEEHSYNFFFFFILNIILG